VHDIGLRLHRSSSGAIGWEVMVGGGQGRTPMIAVTVRDFLPENELIGYLEAIMRVYNLYGRRDNKYKARIKILVHEIGAEAFKAAVEEEYARNPAQQTQVEARELARIAKYFVIPQFEKLSRFAPHFEDRRATDPAFAAWARNNLAEHKNDGYTIVNISLKDTGEIPGDATGEQMRVMADLAVKYSHDELRVSHAQNIVLPHVRKEDVPAIYDILKSNGLAAANYGLLGDIIACPGMDYCSLATARSIPIAQAISRKFGDIKKQEDIGPLKINISGCINACGHHHVGHIGILGLDKKGEEFYQITLGGSSSENASIGSILGPGFAGHEVPDAIEKILSTYLKLRKPGEEFLGAYRRLGPAPFKEALYATL
jgi:sulfite reductase (NADPH) hemoprotein beta-component